MRNILLNTSYCNKNQNRRRPVSKPVYICGFYSGKLGRHPEIFSSLAYTIKLLKITIKTKTGLLMYVYFLLYLYLWSIFWQIGILIPIWLPLWINHSYLFIYNASHNNFYDYFLSEYALFEFWNVEF